MICFLSDSAGAVEAVHVDHAAPGQRLSLVGVIAYATFWQGLQAVLAKGAVWSCCLQLHPARTLRPTSKLSTFTAIFSTCKHCPRQG